LTERKFVSCDI